MGAEPVDCPCGCGAQVSGVVAGREERLREDTLSAPPVRKLPGREHAAVYLVTDLPGAGKSTVAKLLALHFDRSAHIDIDMVYHHFTVAGLVPPAEETSEAGGQALLTAVNAAGMARNYVAAGFVCVLEGAIATRSHVLACQQAVAPHPLHLDAEYDSAKTRDELAGRGMTGQIAHKGEKAPIQAGQRWPVERTNAWHNAFSRLQRCYERREDVIDAFFDLADAIITVRSLIRQAWTTYRWDSRPARRP